MDKRYKHYRHNSNIKVSKGAMDTHYTQIHVRAPSFPDTGTLTNMLNAMFLK